MSITQPWNIFPAFTVMLDWTPGWKLMHGTSREILKLMRNKSPLFFHSEVLTAALRDQGEMGKVRNNS